MLIHGALTSTCCRHGPVTVKSYNCLLGSGQCAGLRGLTDSIAVSQSRDRGSIPARVKTVFK